MAQHLAGLCPGKEAQCHPCRIKRDRAHSAYRTIRLLGHFLLLREFFRLLRRVVRMLGQDMFRQCDATAAPIIPMIGATLDMGNGPNIRPSAKRA